MAENTSNKQTLVVSAGLFTTIVVAGYVITYRFAPFSEFINTLILNLLTVISALVCALLISRVAFYFEQGEPLRRIWTSFAVALWMWTIAEVIWAVYNLTVEVVPSFSAADVLWMAAYIFLADALSNQFGLILFDRSQRPMWIGLAISAVIFAGIAFFTQATGGALAEFSGYFYPIADLAVGVAALVLVILFRRGKMAWPWLSLLVFMISDSLYTWATVTGVYDWNAGGGILTLLIDLLYLIAYLFMAWGVLNQYMALRFAE